ncbi:hypothetical protein HRR80_004812 [Exophiala dermatitidis]|nr:hypothetical protein HRR75_004679 [Exophiala dermatitidis]KAJ4545943.1 hypothetical protein HRR78_005782 [Exophiala dermatitidis]KAJ8991480.1 hypothetical protein HRR80_004812 [Exophiala dermatitidis]
MASVPPNSPAVHPSTTTAPLIPDQTVPNVFISDILTARAVTSPNWAAPNRPKIRYVLSVVDSPEKQPKLTPGHESDFVLHFVRMLDHANMDILELLSETNKFIKDGLANNDGGVLVHCHKGISRSAAVIIAFVMQDMNLDYDTALRYIRTFRSKVNPNPGFKAQLELWRQWGYSIYEANGEPKEEYQIWKANNEEQIRGLPERTKKYFV